MRRVHRTFFERVTCMAKYRCQECHSTDIVSRPYRLHLGQRCRCPRCGTFRVTKLKMRDKIDPMEGGFLNLMEKCAGGKLYHCKFCRVQFWDRRRWAPPAAAATAAQGGLETAAEPDAEEDG